MPSFLQSPRGAVKLGGFKIEFGSNGIEASRTASPIEIITGWTSWEVDNNAMRLADTFNITFIISSLPADKNLEWFATQSIIQIEIYANSDVSGNYIPQKSDLLITGNADSVDIDMVQGTITLAGRDLTALIIDTKTSEHFANQTSSQIATTIAHRHGLVPNVTATSEIVGQYYEYDRVTLSQERSEWEILTYLANVEGFGVYVLGNTLYFNPIATEPTVYPINIDVGKTLTNVIMFSASRNLTIAKGVSVEVRSWNRKQGSKKSQFHPIISTFPRASKGAKAGTSGSSTQIYKRWIAGLTQVQADKKAEEIYRLIIAHELHISAELPADNTLTANCVVAVTGTHTDFDQTYYPESVKRSMSIGEGYRMSFTAKNSSPAMENVD